MKFCSCHHKLHHGQCPKCNCRGGMQLSGGTDKLFSDGELGTIAAALDNMGSIWEEQADMVEALDPDSAQRYRALSEENRRLAKKSEEMIW